MSDNNRKYRAGVTGRVLLSDHNREYRTVTIEVYFQITIENTTVVLQAEFDSQITVGNIALVLQSLTVRSQQKISH